MFKFFFGSNKRMVLFATIGWSSLLVLHYMTNGTLFYLGYVYLTLAVLTPTNFYLAMRKEKDTPKE